MTANFSLYIVDGDWLAQTPSPSVETVSDHALYDHMDLEQSSIDWVFQFRKDALRYLTNGEFGPAGGYAEWDGSDCYMGFTSAQKTAEIASILSEMSPEALMQFATWIDDAYRDEIAHCLNAYYSDLKQFVEQAAAEGNGLACLFVN